MSRHLHSTSGLNAGSLQSARAEMAKKGTGHRPGQSLRWIDEETVAFIRWDLQTMSHRAIAEKYSVAFHRVMAIAKNRTFVHVDARDPQASK